MKLISRFMIWIITFVLSLALVALGIIMFVTTTDWKGIMADYVTAVQTPFMSLPNEELPTIPTLPTDQTLPTEPTIPTEPTAPEEPTEPTDPVEPN